jgi:hypothetical protein
MTDFSYWREKAAEYVRLAKDCSDPLTAEWMTKLASVYLAAAEDIEAKSSQKK